MSLMRKHLVQLLPLSLLLGSVLCNALHATPLFPSNFAQQQSSSQSAPAETGDQAQAAAPSEKLSLGDQVIQDVLEPLRAGMVTQNIQMVLSIFDKKELNGYSDLQGQLRAFFHQASEVRFRYQLLQATSDADRGSATAEMEMDALPYEVTTTPVRRSVQMRFQLKLEPKGWKVTGFSPSDFFAVGFNPAETQ